MGYVIYNKATTRIKGKYVYKTHAAAQAAITRWSNKWFNERWKELYPNVGQIVAMGGDEDPKWIYAIAEEEYFRKHIEKNVTRTNLMTGAEYTESVNTPLACSPASETYWSM
jgi:hypothetical protein